MKFRLSKCMASTALSVAFTGAAVAQSSQVGPTPGAGKLAAPTIQATSPQIPPLPAGLQPLQLAVPTKPGVGLTPEEFGALLNMTLPLSEDQVRTVNIQSELIKKARLAHVGPAPRAESAWSDGGGRRH